METKKTSERVDLSSYRNPDWHDKGRNILVRSLWHIVNAIFLQNPINPSSRVKVFWLRAFGAKIGNNCVFKPAINVKSPWKISIGDNAWIGECAWLDSVAPIQIGADVCISQGAYLCTGNHDWSDTAFGLIEWPLVIEDGAWIGARAVILPGARVASHTIIAAGSVLSKSTEPYTIYAGNPAFPVKKRTLLTRSPEESEAMQRAVAVKSGVSHVKFKSADG